MRFFKFIFHSAIFLFPSPTTSSISRSLFHFAAKKYKRAWFIIMKHIFLFPSAFPLSYLQFRKQIWLLLQWRSTMRGNLIRRAVSPYVRHRYLFKCRIKFHFNIRQFFFSSPHFNVLERVLSISPSPLWTWVYQSCLRYCGVKKS